MKARREPAAFTLRLPLATVKRIDQLAQTAYGGASRSSVVRMAIERLLREPATPRA